MKSRTVKRLLLVALGVVAVVGFISFDLGRYLTLSYLKESRETFQALYGANRLPVIGLFALIYITVTALSLPGAAVMSLAGGALFGLLVGLVVVSFSSVIGATLACLVSRYLLRDWVQARFGDKLHSINEGVRKEGAFYLFTLRLIPLFPFFVINLLMGLTTMPIRTFFWVSQLGMLAGTFVFVNAGKELANINSLGDILSPGLIVSFVLLGLFPLMVKKIMALVRPSKQIP